jgi:hypothetical protein
MRKIALERQNAQQLRILPVLLALLQNADMQERFQKMQFHNQSVKNYKLQFHLKNTKF